ncbi:MAG: NAD-dependent epimerase/dehydratase family protein, partial [Bacillus sp. (in: firmicutes)]
MKALFIGGTGTISSAITKQLVTMGCDLYLLNRGNQKDRLPEGINLLQADINNEDQVSRLIEDLEFDVVADFIAFEPAQLERNYRLFKGKTKQFIFISSASA